MDYVFVAAGLLLLLVGGEVLVRGAVGLARAARMSAALIGITVVGFGTSMPELVTSLKAAAAGSPGIAVGNVVGSNIANILLILGVAAVIRPMTIDAKGLRRDGAMMAFAALCMVVVAMTGELGRVAGLAFVAALLVYLVYAARNDSGAELPEEVEGPAPALPMAALLTVAGLGALVLGADLLVEGALGIARNFGVSEAVIGLTVVALGTSLPELAASAAAALKRESDLAVGNVIGSNIYNILGILGITAVVSPIEVPARIAQVDVWIMLAVTAAILVLALRGSLGRVPGALLLGGYGAYVLTMLA